MSPDRVDPRRRRKLLLAAAATPWVVGGGALGAAIAPGGIDAALRQRLAREGVGFAAAEVGAETTRVHLAGRTHAGDGGPIEATTLFELGSLTKPFVALLLADGVLRRRHAFDDPVEDALPAGLRLRDSAGQPLRLIDLATHRSGLPRLPLDLRPAELADPYPRYEEDRLNRFLHDWRPLRRRGERFEYSNLGYGLLALVLARRLGLSFDAALKRDVLDPLGLVDLRIARPIPPGEDLAAIGGAIAASLSIAPRLAGGHDARLRSAPAWRFAALAGAVGLVGPITDVARFMQAALRLLDTPLAEAFSLCLRHHGEGSLPLHPFGLAWEMSTIVAPTATRELFNQDGATAGFSSSLWLEPARQRGGAVLANAFIETRSLALQALDASLDETAFNRMLLPAEALAALAGRYARPDRSPDQALTIRPAGDRLWLHTAGPSSFELLPSAPRRFFMRDAAMEFEFDDATPPRQLLVHRDGRALPYRRQP